VRKRLASIGTSVSAISNEHSSANTTTSASSWNKVAVVERMNITGRKITQVVSVEAMMAPVTCRAPRSALASGAMPFWRCRTMFSSTTIELSTIMPTPSAMPPNVI
jgi:hypothetical protein